MQFMNAPRALFSVFALTLCNGCVATPFYGRPLSDRIVKDSAAFNNAIYEASNQQILTNILRSRDRLPRQYAGFKDISTTQTRSVGGQFGLGTIPFGNPATGTATNPIRNGKLWGVGNLSSSLNAQTSPSYGLSPVVGDVLNKAALSPTDAKIFVHYWNEGWPRDVLLDVLINKATPLETACISMEHLGGLSSTQDPTTYEEESLNLLPQINYAVNSRLKNTKCTDKEKTETVLALPVGAKRNNPDAIGRDGDSEFFQFARDVEKTRGTWRVKIVKIGPAPSSKEQSLTHSNALTATDWQKITESSNDLKQTGLSTSIEPSHPKTKTPIKISFKPSDDRSQFLVLEKYQGPEKERKRYLLTLRSFDQALYFLGELIRPSKGNDTKTYATGKIVLSADQNSPEYDQDTCDNIQSNGKNTSATASAEGERAPLITIYQDDGIFGRSTAKSDHRDEDMIWAAKSYYRGNWFMAGPPSGYRNTKCNKEFDRTSSVLTLLGQLFELNRSPESLRLPAQFDR
ncbi:MAG: hypothetical protein R3C60_00780 [Parvularculaceae bacterium]